jgi:hypothetical protein
LASTGWTWSVLLQYLRDRCLFSPERSSKDEDKLFRLRHILAPK